MRWFALLFLICPIVMQAQITITRNDMPQSGDTVRVMNAQIGNIGSRLAATGPNFNWDFSDLQPAQDELLAYRPGIQTPYFFFLTAYGVKVADEINLFVTSFRNVYDFYNLNNNRLAITGRGITIEGLPLPAFYSDPDEQFFLPLTYGRRDTSTFAWGLTVPTFGGYQSRGGRLTEVDGYGTITTPFGSFECLRVRSTLRIIDSVSFNGLNLNLPPRTEVEYYWLAKDEKAPVLKARGTSFFGNFTPQQVQYRYQPPELRPPLKVNVPNGQVLLYPNPATERLFVAVGNLDQVRAVQLFDEYGKLVLSFDHNPPAGIDCYPLQSGVYTVRVTGDYGTYTSKAVVAPR